MVDAAGPEPVLDLVGALAAGVPSSVLVAEVSTGTLPAALPRWSLGPLPIVQALNETAVERGHARTTNEDARRTLVADQQAAVLYGRDRLVRAYRVVHQDGAAAPILALELLLGPQEAASPNVVGLVAVHITAHPHQGDTEDPLRRHLELTSGAIHRGARNDVDLWAEVQRLLPEGVDLNGERRVRSVNFHVLDADRPGDTHQAALVNAYLLVGAASPKRIPDMEKRALRHELSIERKDWSGLVLRDGMAFIAHQASEESFTEVLRVLTHSVHLDAMLLGLIQRRLVDVSGMRTVHASIDDPSELVRLERSHFDFKRTYWRTSLTDKRTAPSDEVLRAFQAELLTNLDVADVEDRVRDGAKLARTLHAEQQDRSQQRLARMVQNASVIIGALGLSFTAAPALAIPSLQLFASAAAAGILGMFVAFLALRVTGRRAGR